MRRFIEGVIAAVAAGLALSVTAAIPAHASGTNQTVKKPIPTVTTATTASLMVLEGHTLTGTVSTGTNNLNLFDNVPTQPPTSNRLDGIAVTTGDGSVRVADPSKLSFIYTTNPVVPFNKPSTVVLSYTLAADYSYQKPPSARQISKGQTNPVQRLTVTSAPATVTIHVQAVAPQMLYLSPPLYPGFITGEDSAVIVGGVLNADEFLGNEPLDTTAYTEQVRLNVRSTTCPTINYTTTFVLPENSRQNYQFRATPGNWVVSTYSNLSGERTIPFSIGGLTNCVLPAGLAGITLAPQTSVTRPDYVAPYTGVSNQLLSPNTTKNLFVKTPTGFPASVQEDSNSVYDAAQAASGAKGCHAVGTGANVRFIGCDDIAPVPGNSSSSSAFTSTPAIVVYVIIGFALLASAFARRARGKSA